MRKLLLSFLSHLVADATRLRDVNTTAGESTVLPCTLMTATPTAVNNLRFYWQDKSNQVWYSFSEGKEIMEHVNGLWRDRITAFPQDMTTGNISVKFKDPTLEDNQRVFRVFASVLKNGAPTRYSLEHEEICQITLHVAGKDMDFTFLNIREDVYHLHIYMLNIKLEPVSIKTREQGETASLVWPKGPKDYLHL